MVPSVTERKNCIGIVNARIDEVVRRRTVQLRGPCGDRKICLVARPVRLLQAKVKCGKMLSCGESAQCAAESV